MRNVDLDEEIDIAVLAIVAPRHRTEHSHVARSVTCGNLQNLAPVPPKRFEPHVRVIAAAISAGHSAARSANVPLVEAAD